MENPNFAKKNANIGQKFEMTRPQNARLRICVKNLPRYVSEDRLREFFSLKGEITNTKLMRTKDGKSRQFGFVDYRTEQEAREAIKYFDKSFMDTCRISCEIAWKVGDPEIPHPWSWYQVKCGSLSKEEKILMGSKRSIVATTKGEINKSKKTDGSDDSNFQEFLQVMQLRSKSKLWSNDTPTASYLELGKGVGNKKCYLYENQHGLIKDTLRQDVLEVKAEDCSSEEHSNKVFDLVSTSGAKDEKEEILKTGHLIIFNMSYVSTEESWKNTLIDLVISQRSILLLIKKQNGPRAQHLWVTFFQNLLLGLLRS